MMFWTSAFILGLVGSLHCGVMCGPIVLATSTLNQTGKTIFIIRQLAYNMGRIFTYLIIGAIIGLIGKGLSLVGFQQTLSIVSGLLIFTLYFYPKYAPNSKNSNVVVLRFTNFLKKRIGPFIKNQNITSKFILGFINGFLPCGLVYIAAAGAIATGEPDNAAIFMLLFGLGTVPMLFGISIFHSFFGNLKNLNLSRVIPIFVATISILFILRGLNLGIPYVSPMISSQQLEQNVVCD
jgi:sulfite exporter TauE/SafE